MAGQERRRTTTRHPHESPTHGYNAARIGTGFSFRGDLLLWRGIDAQDAAEGGIGDHFTPAFSTVTWQNRSLCWPGGGGGIGGDVEDGLGVGGGDSTSGAVALFGRPMQADGGRAIERDVLIEMAGDGDGIALDGVASVDLAVDKGLRDGTAGREATRPRRRPVRHRRSR